jgi:hypothetical protein
MTTPVSPGSATSALTLLNKLSQEAGSKAQGILNEAATVVSVSPTKDGALTRAELASIFRRPQPDVRAALDVKGMNAIREAVSNLVLLQMLESTAIDDWTALTRDASANPAPAAPGPPDRKVVAIENLAATMVENADFLHHPEQRHIAELKARIADCERDTPLVEKRRALVECIKDNKIEVPLIAAMSIAYDDDASLETVRAMYHELIVEKGGTIDHYSINLLNNKKDRVTAASIYTHRLDEPYLNKSFGVVHNWSKAVHAELDANLAAIARGDVTGAGGRFSAFKEAPFAGVSDTLKSLNTIVSDIAGGQEYIVPVEFTDSGESFLNCSALASALVMLLKGQITLKKYMRALHKELPKLGARRGGPRGGDASDGQVFAQVQNPAGTGKRAQRRAFQANAQLSMGPFNQQQQQQQQVHALMAYVQEHPQQFQQLFQQQQQQPQQQQPQQQFQLQNRPQQNRNHPPAYSANPSGFP